MDNSSWDVKYPPTRKPQRTSVEEESDGLSGWALAIGGVTSVVGLTGWLVGMEIKRRMYKKLFILKTVLGCIRFALLATSCWLMLSHQWMAVGTYVLSIALNPIFDAVIASKLDKVAGLFTFDTKLGSLVHALADRCTDLGLLSGLCVIYPNYMLLFMMIIALDTSSHWMHAHSYMANPSRSYKLLLSKFNFFNKVFFVVIYICSFTSGPYALFGYHLFPLLAIITGPSIVLKAFNGVLQLWEAATKLAKLDFNS